MAKKNNTVYKSYTESGKRYMICRNSIEGGKYWSNVLCGEWVEVTPNTTAVLCNRCVNRITEPPKFTPRYKPTGRPKGWQWMKEYVDKDGNVFHKGKEQPQLKGTLSPTVIEPKSKKTKRKTKREREAEKRTLMAQLYDLKKKHKKVTLKKDKKAVEVQIRKLSRKLKIKIV